MTELEIDSFIFYHMEMRTISRDGSVMHGIIPSMYYSVEEGINDAQKIWDKGDEIRIVRDDTDEIEAWIHEDGEIYMYDYLSSSFIFLRSIL